MNVTKRLAAAFLVLALTATTGSLAAPTEQHPCCALTSSFGSSPVWAWSWGASQSGSVVGGGKANFQDLSLTRNTDGQSPQYLHALATGIHLPTLVLVDGSANISLADVIVTSYATGGSTGGSKGGSTLDALTENITFMFGTLRYTVDGVTTCVGSACPQ